MNRRLRILYDPEADALLIKTGEGRPSYGEELADQVIVHFDEHGKPVEILDATELLAKLAEAVESAKAGQAHQQRTTPSAP
jgi:uncharacterized protein YuzE